jgi:hypothetical protein
VEAAPVTPSIRDALSYWEPRRLAYNGALLVQACAWVVLTWPHFQPAFTLGNLGRVLILAGIANVCYCAAYLIDVPLQEAFGHTARRPWRFPVWLLGTLLALLVAQYWIGDEIYPFINAT